MDKSSREYKVIGKKKESATVTTLHLLPVGISKPAFISGQFLTVYFPELGTREGKAYSLSSSLYEETLSLSVKEMGSYSKKLSSMEVGETLRATGPHGFFYSEEEGTHLVMVAGGIGVAPFRGMVLSLLSSHTGRKCTLYYSVSSLQDAAFLDEFFSLQESNQFFSLVVYATKEVSDREGIRHGRISAGDLFTEFKQDPTSEYLICGSIQFVRDMWKGLKEQGVPEDRLYTEAFFS